MPKKYELTDETFDYYGTILHRIKALIDIPDVVKSGDLGGWIEYEENLSHEGKCWVYDNAKVYEDSWVSDNAKVYGNADVSGHAKVYGDAEVYGNAEVCGDAEVYGNAEVCDNAEVAVDACVYDNAVVCDNARVVGYAKVCSNANVCGYAKVCDGEVRKTSDIIITGPIVSRYVYATFNKTSGTVCTGCFTRTIDEFEKILKESHGDREYVKVCTGFFKGPIDEFEKILKESHGDSECGNVYCSVIATFKAVCDNARE